MAIRDVRVQGGNGIGFTKECDSSADHASIANGTYFKDLSEGIGGLILYKDLTGNILNAYEGVYGPSSTNTLYVDSEKGLDAPNRGSVNKPYRTVEYVLANVTNTGTFTCNTNTNTSLTAISDANNALLKVGQYVTGTNIPYGTIITAKNNEGSNNNSVVLSQATTGTGAITGTWWTMYELKGSGSFTYVSTWLKNGFVFDFGTSTITFNNTVFNATTSHLVPFWSKGGVWRGNNANSKLWSSTFSSSADFLFEPLDYFSIGTGSQINSNQNGVQKYGSMTIKCPKFIASLGRIADFESFGNTIMDGYFYGLLSGIIHRYTKLSQYGKIDCPSSVSAITGTDQNGSIQCFGQITGNLTTIKCPSIFSSDVTGTAHTLQQTNNALKEITINGNISGSITNTGWLIVNGQHIGSVTNSGTYKGSFVTGVYSGTGSSKGEFIGLNLVSSDVPSVTLTGTSIFTLLDSQLSITATTQANISVASGCLFVNKGFLRCQITSLLGTGLIINDGRLVHQWNSSVITGKMINNGIIELTRDGQTEAAGGGIYSPVLIFSTGTYEGNSDLICNVADSKSGLIRMTGAAKIFLKDGQYLKVANGLSPLQILTSAGSTTIYDFGAISNVSQATYDAAFSDTTYGATSAPTYVSTRHSTANNF